MFIQLTLFFTQFDQCERVKDYVDEFREAWANYLVKTISGPPGKLWKNKISIYIINYFSCWFLF